MARSLSSEDLRRLAERGPCAGILAAKGAASAYLADCLVRHYQTRSLVGLLADLGDGAQADQLTIAAGIGDLILRPGGTQFVPASTSRPISSPMPVPTASLSAEPRQADAATRDRRQALCTSCSRWADRCTVAGCACAGLGQAERAFSRCPEGRW